MSQKISITDIETLSDGWSKLKKVTYEYETEDGQLKSAHREVYDRGNGVVILLYNKHKGTVILIKQLRIPTFLNHNPTGMMIEACAGMLDEKNPEDCILREVEEETGFRIPKVEKIFESYMSPGAVTEILHFYIAEYTDEMKVSEGGGLDEEHEDIEVLELSFDKAYQMIFSGEIKDGKTIMLLQYAKTHKLFC